MGGSAQTPSGPSNTQVTSTLAPQGGGGKLAQLRASQGDAAANAALGQYYQGTLPSQQPQTSAPQYGGGGWTPERVQAAQPMPNTRPVSNLNPASPFGAINGVTQQAEPNSGRFGSVNGLGQRSWGDPTRQADPQGIGRNINWEEVMKRYRPGQGQQGQGRGGNPWQGGHAAMRDRFTQGNPREAITNPGSVAASQGAPTSSGITAPGAVTGAPATPTGANPNDPANQLNRPQQGRAERAQQLIAALRARQGG